MPFQVFGGVSVASSPVSEEIEEIARSIDQATASGDESSLAAIIKSAEPLFGLDLEGDDFASLHYHVGTAWANLNQSRMRTCAGAGGVLRHPMEEFRLEHEKVIFHFRSSIQLAECMQTAFDHWPQVFTNLGNEFDEIGRYVEAMTCYSQALVHEPEFGMARGNRAKAINDFSEWHQFVDLSQKTLMAKHAYDELKEAIAGPAELTTEALGTFGKLLNGYQGRATAEFFKIDVGGFLAKNEKALSPVEAWSVKNRLALNALNEIFDHSIARKDLLHIQFPDVPPEFQEFFGLLKSDFITARSMAYAAVVGMETAKENEAEESERREVEKNMTLALRIAYSLFDKIGHFIQYFWIKDAKEKRLSFKNLWYEKPGAVHNPALRAEFEDSRNPFLRGLFWLSKDIWPRGDEEKKNRMVIEPEAEKIGELRNFVEHKFVLMDWKDGIALSAMADRAAAGDGFCLCVTQEDFLKKTVKTLKLARAALFYLSYAVLENRLLAENAATRPN